MAKRKIPKLTSDELAARERLSREVRERIAERRALEAEWDRAEEEQRRSDAEKRSA